MLACNPLRFKPKPRAAGDYWMDKAAGCSQSSLRGASKIIILATPLFLNSSLEWMINHFIHEDGNTLQSSIGRNATA